MSKRKVKKLSQPLLNIEKRIDNSITFIVSDSLLKQQGELMDNLVEIKKSIINLKESLKLKD